MTGWITFSKAPEAHYRADMADGDASEEVVWPPKFFKFELEVDDDGNRVAFTDPRRLGRVRLINTPADNIRKVSPLKENGPDPVVDGLDEKWFTQILMKRKVPVKALLLDQAFISGVGNWVGDEILFHAHIHPEQYSNTLSEAQQKQLYQSTLHICQTACDLLGDSSKFPPDWLFKYRWGKGKKGNKLPSGEKIDFVKVGGRTSAYVKSRQKATGGTAVKKEAESDDGETPKKSTKKRKAVKAEEEDEEDAEDDEEEYTPAKKGRRSVKAKVETPAPAKRGRKSAKKEESDKEQEPVETKPVKRSRPAKKVQDEAVVNGKDDGVVSSGRRSGRSRK
ncbi:hypothetical protein ABW21_db0204090 [Orbilia brochopaga]|nr:hypothetical protein ABW21_db0204090 [Drechslerella brochopaga]